MIKKGIKLLSLLCGCMLLLAYLSVYVSPSFFWPIAFFGLLFQLSLIVNIFLLFIWFFLKRRFLWVTHFICLLPSVFIIGNFIRPFGSDKIATPNLPKIKVMTYNVHNFQLLYGTNDSTFKKIAQHINNEQPDILCFQEYFTAQGKLTNRQIEEQLSSLKFNYVFSNIVKQNTFYGLAVYSKYPIKMQMELPFEATANAAMYADIEINEGKIIRVFNTHLQSVKLNLNKSLLRIFGKQDEDRIDELEQMSQRLRTAFVKRASQVDMLAQHIRVSPYPVIVCGDFNDTPMSYTYSTTRARMNDAFCEAGRGMPSTMTGLFPSFRIDYILHEPIFRCLSYKVDHVSYSDHRPVVAEFEINFD